MDDNDRIPFFVYKCMRIGGVNHNYLGDSIFDRAAITIGQFNAARYFGAIKSFEGVPYTSHLTAGINAGRVKGELHYIRLKQLNVIRHAFPRFDISYVKLGSDTYGDIAAQTITYKDQLPPELLETKGDCFIRPVVSGLSGEDVIIYGSHRYLEYPRS